MATPKKSKAKRNTNNTTGYHGVTRDTNGNYVAQIFHQGKTIRIITTKKAIDAAKAYDAKAVELKGEKAKLNFPV
jgi:hypothetical protein